MVSYPQRIKQKLLTLPPYSCLPVDNLYTGASLFFYTQVAHEGGVV